jgi:hypothetical protein
VDQDPVGPSDSTADMRASVSPSTSAASARRERRVHAGEAARVRHAVRGRDLRRAQLPRELGAAREEQRRGIHERAPRERVLVEQRGAERVVRIDAAAAA